MLCLTTVEHTGEHKSLAITNEAAVLLSEQDQVKRCTKTLWFPPCRLLFSCSTSRAAACIKHLILPCAFSRTGTRAHLLVCVSGQDLEDFPSIFETAIADFRTLLSNSAFGDALLLKMVVICIFSVTHVAAVQNIGAAGASGYTAPDYNALSNEAFSNAGSGVDTTSGDGGNSDRSGGGGGASGTGSGGLDTAASKADDVRRKARLSYPLALAFGVSAQIGRHVRTQEPTHPSQGSQHHAGGGGHGHGRNHIRHGSHGSAHGGPGSDSGMLPGGSGHHHHHHSGGEHVPPAPVVVYGVDSKSRPSSNQPQPRPLGSRLLGPVVLFCDWLTAQPRFLRLVEEDKAAAGSSTGNSGGGSSGSGVSRGSGGSSRGGGAMVVRVGRAGGAVASVAVQEVISVMVEAGRVYIIAQASGLVLVGSVLVFGIC